MNYLVAGYLNGFLIGSSPASFYFYFGLLRHQYNFIANKGEKWSTWVVSGTGIQTHDLLYMSLIPLPLD